MHLIYFFLRELLKKGTNFRRCLNFSDPPLNSLIQFEAKKHYTTCPWWFIDFFCNTRPSKVFIHRKYRNVTNILIDCFLDWDLERGLRGDSVPDTITKTLIGWSIEMVTTWAVGWQWTTGNVVPTIKCVLWQVGATRLDSSWCSG